MDTETKNNHPVAISIENCSNIHLDNNTSINMPLLQAKNVDQLSLEGNRVISHSNSKDRTEGIWSKTIFLRLFLNLIIAIAAGGILHMLGWV